MSARRVEELALILSTFCCPPHWIPYTASNASVAGLVLPALQTPIIIKTRQRLTTPWRTALLLALLLVSAGLHASARKPSRSLPKQLAAALLGYRLKSGMTDTVTLGSSLRAITDGQLLEVRTAVTAKTGMTTNHPHVSTASSLPPVKKGCSAN